jgi:hypothetical protein
MVEAETEPDAIAKSVADPDADPKSDAYAVRDGNAERSACAEGRTDAEGHADRESCRNLVPNAFANVGPGAEDGDRDAGTDNARSSVGIAIGVACNSDVTGSARNGCAVASMSEAGGSA